MHLFISPFCWIKKACFSNFRILLFVVAYDGVQNAKEAVVCCLAEKLTFPCMWMFLSDMPLFLTPPARTVSEEWSSSGDSKTEDEEKERRSPREKDSRDKDKDADCELLCCCCSQCKIV